MALLKLEDIKKLLDDNKIDLKDLEKLNELEEIKKKNEKIIGLLDKFEKLINNKKISASKVNEILENVTTILNDNLPKRKPKSKTSAPKKVENIENLNENENNQNV